MNARTFTGFVLLIVSIASLALFLLSDAWARVAQPELTAPLVHTLPRAEGSALLVPMGQLGQAEGLAPTSAFTGLVGLATPATPATGVLVGDGSVITDTADFAESAYTTEMDDVVAMDVLLIENVRVSLDDDTGVCEQGADTLATRMGNRQRSMAEDRDHDRPLVPESAPNAALSMYTASVAFTVTATSPTSNGLIVDRDSIISATFSRSVDSSTVSTCTFAVWGKQTGIYAQSYSFASNSVSFDAQPDYMPGEEIVVNLSRGLRATDGVPLTPYAWQFRAAVMGGSGAFDSGQGPGSGQAVALGDVDSDGDLDAFIAGSGTNKVWLNDGMGTFADSGQSLGDSLSLGVALGDVDGDGDIDAFVANWNSEANKVWLNDGMGTFTSNGQSLGSLSSRAVALGDVDGDSDIDAFVANDVQEANKVWLNDGMGTFTDSGQSLGGSSSHAIALGDVDGDGDLDAFVANGPVQATSKVWLNDGAGVFIDSGQSVYSSYGQAVALGDVDGDGDLDAFIAHDANQANKVWLNDGMGTFTDSGQSLGSSKSHAVVLGDVDSDCDIDAFVANHNGEANKVWLNDGIGTFTDSGQSLGSLSSRAVSLGDVDGDGDIDALVANYGGSNSNRIWMNGNASGKPEVTVDPLALSAILDPGDEVTCTLVIGNVGDASLTWSLAEESTVTWLSEAPRSGVVAPSGSSDVIVTFDASGLTDGVYTTTLRVSSNDPDTPQVDVSVVLTLGPGDAYEPDGTCAQASALATDGTAQRHTFHQHGDEDWVHFIVTSGNTYMVQAASTGPLADTALELHDNCATSPLPPGDLDLGPSSRLRWTAFQDTTYYLRVTNHSPGDYGPQASYDLSVRAASAVGAAIVVAGRNDGGTLHPNINFAANRAARVFLDAGLSRTHLHYLNSDSNPGGGLTPDAPATSANLQHAIEIWAVDKVGPDQQFYLYLVDHGGQDVFLTDGSEDLTTAADLDEWLATLEAATECPVNVIFEACRSGSFIDDSVDELIDDISKGGRVVIASTSATRNAYALPGRGAYFSDSFLTALNVGADLWTAFRVGQQGVAAHGLWQTPWLDDDGDATPHLYDPDDGMEARRRGLAGLGYGGVAPYIEMIGGPAEIVDGQGTVRARVVDDLGVDFVWALVYPPSFEEPATSDEETINLDDELGSFVLRDSDGDGEYESGYTGFTEVGAYRVVVYAKDEDGNLAPPQAVIVRTGWQVYLPLVYAQ